ncbi:hypothetical protein PoB_004375100 [Plakobranchus ocellatus]|uniref:Reverse transcriptase domain-containing protein n=1 Tax=Plakobranchus ocellatus TaxID=259542 RepID=A0AAV4B1K3_9GAST|nr:hypothetical protein PoB_004375100 [Plakobranchus ocellatus]
MLFADDAALTAHTEATIQELINCTEFGLTITIKKTNILGQNILSAPSIFNSDSTLDFVENFTYLVYTISSIFSLETELNSRNGKASPAMARLSKRVWENSMCTIKTKTQVHQVSVHSTLLYGSESWTLYARQERRLNTIHLRCSEGSFSSHGRTTFPIKRSLKGQNTRHVCFAYQETFALAWPCHPYVLRQTAQNRSAR